MSPDSPTRVLALEERMAAQEGRLADLERRIAELERAAGQQVPWWPVPATDGVQFAGCRVCGRGADGRPDWYVCTRSDCPSAVTCTASAKTPDHLVGRSQSATDMVLGNSSPSQHDR